MNVYIYGTQLCINGKNQNKSAKFLYIYPLHRLKGTDYYQLSTPIVMYIKHDINSTLQLVLETVVINI